MLFKNHKKKDIQKGFSLVELMVVVGIIGLLATLGVPRFRIYQAKARQAEAKNTLSHIYTLQQSYFGDNDKYGNLSETNKGNNCSPAQNDIGLALSGCSSLRYSYSVTATTTSFTATATSGTGENNLIIPGCSTADIWTIDQDKKLTHKQKSSDDKDCN